MGYENKKKYPIYMPTKYCEDKHVDLLLIEEGGGTMLLSKILTHPCMITHYIAAGNIFVVIVYALLEQQTH